MEEQEEKNRDTKKKDRNTSPFWCGTFFKSVPMKLMLFR